MKRLRGDIMAVDKLELDRKTFDIIQSNLAANGHEAAAGYMVKLAMEFRGCFTKKKFTIKTNASVFTEEQIQDLVDALNETDK